MKDDNTVLPEAAVEQPRILIETFGDVVVSKESVKFEGGWSFRVPDALGVTPADQATVSLAMLEWAIHQLFEAKAKIETHLGIAPPIEIVSAQPWDDEKQAAWEAMTPDERHAALQQTPAAGDGN